MEQVADLVVEVFVLWKLHEATRRFCLAFPASSDARNDCEGGDGVSRKRKHSEPCCGERDIGVNELLLKYGRHTDRKEYPSRAGKER